MIKKLRCSRFFVAAYSHELFLRNKREKIEFFKNFFCLRKVLRPSGAPKFTQPKPLFTRPAADLPRAVLVVEYENFLFYNIPCFETRQTRLFNGLSLSHRGRFDWPTSHSVRLCHCSVLVCRSIFGFECSSYLMVPLVICVKTRQTLRVTRAKSSFKI